jgi:hypothetical protein
LFAICTGTVCIITPKGYSGPAYPKRRDISGPKGNRGARGFCQCGKACTSGVTACSREVHEKRARVLSARVGRGGVCTALMPGALMGCAECDDEGLPDPHGQYRSACPGQKIHHQLSSASSLLSRATCKRPLSPDGCYSSECDHQQAESSD